jgi:hypothetical protein
MSEHFEMLVDVDVTSEDAERLANSVVDRLRSLGLISGSLNSDCVLGKMGYPPVPQFRTLMNNRCFPKIDFGNCIPAA